MNKNIIFNFTVYLLLINLTSNLVYGANIVYPKSNEVTINASETFFIGSENPDTQLKINHENVEIHPSGGFWHVVNLEIGENIFNIDNGSEIQTYRITRKTANNCAQINDTQIEYEKPFVVQIKNDNIPLRSTPVDGGFNRLQHFQKGMKFKVVGEYANFYKVQLARDDYAWLAKNSVTKLQDEEIQFAQIESYTYDEDANTRTFKLKLNRKTPYTLTEDNGLDLVVYNVEDFPYNKYEFHIVKAGKMFGYKSFYKDDSELVIIVNKEPEIDSEKPLKNLKITLDPGHGGSEYGAIGCLGDKEKDINLSIAQKIEEKLKNVGADVFMTRSDDSDVSLSDRIKLSNQNGSSIFISIHNNALPDSLAHLKSSGTEVYYFYPQSKELAKSVIKSITNETGIKDNGVKSQSYAVLRNTQSLSILVEIAYIINPDDNAKLLNEEFQNKAADSIIQGLENFLNGIQ